MTLLPQSPENKAALRTALATLTAIFLAFALHLDKPYWAGMTVVMVANLYTGSIIDKAIMRVLGTIVGAWFGFFIAKFIVNSFFLYFLINFFLVAVAVYYYNFSKYAYAYLLAALGGFIVIAELAIDPGQSFWVAVWRPIEISLGVLVSAAFAFCVYPNRIEDSVLKEVNRIFDAMDALLTSLNCCLANDDPGLRAQLVTDNLQLKKSIRKATDMVVFMRHEVGYRQQIMDRFRFLLDSCYGLSRTIGYFLNATRSLNRTALGEHLPPDHIMTLIRQDVSDLRDLFFHHKTFESTQSGKALTAFDEQLAQWTNASLDERTYGLLLTHFLRQMTAMLCQLRTMLVLGVRPLPSHRVVTAEQQLRRDPDVIRHSIKAGLAAILALAFWLLSNWPGGLNGIVSSIVISIRKNLFEMHNISAFRLLGCILGGGVAFLSLFFFPLNLYLFLLVIFLSVWVFTLFSFKQVAYAYIGLQANLALVIAMAQEGGPPTSMLPPLERLGGVVIGIIASFLVANVFWRTSLLTMLQRQLRTMRRYLLRNVQYVLATNREGRSYYDLMSISWLCRGLLESLPPQNRKQQHIQQARDEHESLIALHVTVNNILESIDQDAARRTAAMYAVDLSKLEEGIRDSFDDRGQLREALITVLQEPRPASVEPLAMENCAAYLYALEQLVQHRNVLRSQEAIPVVSEPVLA